MLDVDTLKVAFSDSGFKLSKEEIENMIKKIKSESEEEQTEDCISVP